MHGSCVCSVKRTWQILDLVMLHSATWREPQRQHQQAGTAHSGCTWFELVWWSHHFSTLDLQNANQYMVWNLRLDWNRRFCWLHYPCPTSVLLASLVSLSPNSYIKLLTMRIMLSQHETLLKLIFMQTTTKNVWVTRHWRIWCTFCVELGDFSNVIWS